VTLAELQAASDRANKIVKHLGLRVDQITHRDDGWELLVVGPGNLPRFGVVVREGETAALHDVVVSAIARSELVHRG